MVYIAIGWVNTKLNWTDTGMNTLEQYDLYGDFRRVYLLVIQMSPE